MVCKATSCVKAARSRGFTLAEYMVAMSVGMLALAAVAVLWGYGSRTCAVLLNYVELSTTSKNALDRISQQIRNARSVESVSANQLVLFDPDGQRVTYAYNSTDKTLTQTKGTESRTLLTDCSALQFSLFQRTPTKGSSALTTTTSTNTAKVVQMQWTCGRTLIGDKTNTESQVSAKVVIRSQ